jgi:hypothetical protein
VLTLDVLGFKKSYLKVMVPFNRFRSSPKTSFRMDDTGDTSMRIATPSVPPYSLWVEGDNVNNSLDSNNYHGPVSKKLLMGIAEYVVWPPTRMGKLPHHNMGDNASSGPQSRSYWP